MTLWSRKDEGAAKSFLYSTLCAEGTITAVQRRFTRIIIVCPCSAGSCPRSCNSRVQEVDVEGSSSIFGRSAVWMGTPVNRMRSRSSGTKPLKLFSTRRRGRAGVVQHSSQPFNHWPRRGASLSGGRNPHPAGGSFVLRHSNAVSLSRVRATCDASLITMGRRLSMFWLSCERSVLWRLMFRHLNA